MRKIYLFMSLLIGSLALTACSSSSSDGNEIPKDSYETYKSTEFVKYINSQYSGSDKSVVVVKCDDDVNFGYDITNGNVSIGGYALVKDKSNQYSVDGYKYDGIIKNQERFKIYNAQKSKAFSLNIDSNSELNFVIYGLIMTKDSKSTIWKQDKYQIKRSELIDDSFDVIVGNSKVTSAADVLYSFLSQSQKEITANYPQLIIGKWENSTGTKSYEFNADGTVKLDSHVYQYSVIDGSVTITKTENIYTNPVEDYIINLLTDNELQMMNDYTALAWSNRQTYHKVNQ